MSATLTDWLGVIGALAVFLLPLVLAWWLLGRKDRPPRVAKKPSASHEKMPR